MSEVQDRLERLTALWAIRSPEGAATLLPGAAEATLRRVEDFLGQPLHPDLHDLWQWHDGQAPFTWPNPSLQFLGSTVLITIVQSLTTYLDMRRGHLDAIFDSPDWHNPRWIPFADRQHPVLLMDVETGEVLAHEADEGVVGRLPSLNALLDLWEVAVSRDLCNPNLTPAEVIQQRDALGWTRNENVFV